MWTDQGESEWSDPVALESGLLGEGDWTARWIGVAEEPREAPGSRGAWWVRTSFEVAPFGRSRLYVTALGLYEAFIDGQRVGDAELTPGYTQYRARVQYQAFDVGPLLRPGPGPHVLAVLVADGGTGVRWGYRGRRISTARMWRCGRRSRWSRRTGQAGGWRRPPVRTGGPRRRTSRRLT